MTFCKMLSDAQIILPITVYIERCMPVWNQSPILTYPMDQLTITCTSGSFDTMNSFSVFNWKAAHNKICHIQPAKQCSHIEPTPIPTLMLLFTLKLAIAVGSRKLIAHFQLNIFVEKFGSEMVRDPLYTFAQLLSICWLSRKCAEKMKALKYENCFFFLHLVWN